MKLFVLLFALAVPICAQVAQGQGNGTTSFDATDIFRLDTNSAEADGEADVNIAAEYCKYSFQDKEDDCKSWAQQKFCSQTDVSMSYMSQNCAQSCCLREAAGIFDDLDPSEQCAEWVAFCGYNDHVNKRCRQTCYDARKAAKENKKDEGLVPQFAAATRVAAKATCRTQNLTNAYGNDRCNVFAKQLYCTSEQYQSFMSSQCALACCVFTTAGDVEVFDLDPDCPSWAADGWCSATPCDEPCQNVRQTCKLSCSQELEFKNADEMGNVDKQRECQTWVSVTPSWCQTNDHIKENCAKSCYAASQASAESGEYDGYYYYYYGSASGEASGEPFGQSSLEFGPGSMEGPTFGQSSLEFGPGSMEGPPGNGKGNAFGFGKGGSTTPSGPSGAGPTGSTLPSGLPGKGGSTTPSGPSGAGPTGSTLPSGLPDPTFGQSSLEFGPGSMEGPTFGQSSLEFGPGSMEGAGATGFRRM